MTNTQRNWKQTLFTPMRELLGMKPARKTWRQIVADAGLPAETGTLITAVIKRACLWRSEAADVADELIAHFHDGLAAGRSAEELTKNFGDIKAAAKLIKRAKRRNRPLLWHAARRCVHGLAAAIVFYILVAFALAFQQPSPTVDYVATLNQRVDSVPESDRGWPIYRKALIEEKCSMANNNFRPEAVFPPTIISPHPPDPGDPLWPAAVAHLARSEHFLEAFRLGAAKPSLGMPLRLDMNVSAEDLLAIYGQEVRNGQVWQLATKPGEEDRLVNWSPFIAIDEGADPEVAKSMSRSLYAVILPPLGFFRGVTNLFSLDMEYALSIHDGKRAVRDYEAMLGLSRQVRIDGMHLIGQLVSANLEHIANASVQLALHDSPDVFSRDQLITLAHLSAKASEFGDVDFAGEKAQLLDIIQRVYTDDGAGNGHITRDGLRLLFETCSTFQGPNREARFKRGAKQKLFASTAIPVAALLMPSRKEAVDEVERTFGADYKSLPLWESSRVLSQEPVKSNSITIGQMHSFRAWTDSLGSGLYPSLPAASRTIQQGQAFCEATTVAVALEVFHRDHGQYPATLAELVPQYLPTMPIDRSSGLSLLYKLRDEKPLIYGRGLDGKDDGGENTEPGDYVGAFSKTGDWVLYPIPQTQ